MAGPTRERTENWSTDTRLEYVRFDDPKLQPCGCGIRRENCTLSTLRSSSSRRQDDDSMLEIYRTDPRNIIGDPPKRENPHRGADDLGNENSKSVAQTQRQQQEKTPGDVRQMESPEGVAQNFRREEERFDSPEAHCNENSTTGDLGCNKGTDYLDEYSFRKEGFMGLHTEGSLQTSKNCNPVSWSPFSTFRKAWTDAGGSEDSWSHPSRRCHTNCCGTNVHPPENSHSKSSSQQSSRCGTPQPLCGTPQPLRRNHSRTLPLPQKFSLRSLASRSKDPAPGKFLRSIARERTQFLCASPTSKSKPPERRSTLLPYTKAGLPPGMSAPGIEVLAPRRATLIERYQEELTRQKCSGRMKASSYGRKGVCPHCSRALPPSFMKRNEKEDPVHFFARKGSWRGKCDEGLSPLRSPGLEIPKVPPSEDHRSFLSRREQLSPKNRQRSSHHYHEYYEAPNAIRESSNYSASRNALLQESFHYDDPFHRNSHPSKFAARESSHYFASPNPLQESFHYDDDPSQGDSHPPRVAARESSNYCASSNKMQESHQPDDPSCGRSHRPQSTAERQSSNYCKACHKKTQSCNWDIPQITRASSTSANPPRATRVISSPYDIPQAARQASSSDYPQATKVSCGRAGSCAARDLSTENDPHNGRDSCWRKDSQDEKEFLAPLDNLRTVTDSRRQIEPHSARDAFHPYSARAEFDGPRTMEDSQQWHDDNDAAREISLSFEERHSDAWRRKDLASAIEEASSFGGPHAARGSRRHDDTGGAREAPTPFEDTHGQSWRNNDTSAAREASSPLYDSHGHPWRHKEPAATQEASPRFDDPPSDAWKHNSTNVAREVSSPFDDTAGDALRQKHSDAVREMPSYDDCPLPAPRGLLRHDNASPVRLPCCTAQQYDLSPPSSPRSYGQLPSHQPFRPQKDRTHEGRNHYNLPENCCVSRCQYDPLQI